MPANFLYNLTSPKTSLSAGIVSDAILALNAKIDEYPGRSLFSTSFSLEDQVLTHLISSNKLPIRVFTNTGSDRYSILIDTVDFFKINIEVSFRQSRQAAVEFASNHPETARAHAENPSTAPLGLVLQGKHLLISSRRKDQLQATKQNPQPFEWNETKQQAIFYPLFDWSAAKVKAYAEQHKLPHVEAIPAAISAAAPSPQTTVWNQLFRLFAPKPRPFTKYSRSEYFPELLRINQPKQQSVFGLME